MPDAIRWYKCKLKPPKNRVSEQQKLVAEVRKSHQTFRNLSFWSGIALKTVHSWCKISQQKKHKSTELLNLRKEEFKEFLLQDSISFAHPRKKYCRKKFLRDTLEITRCKYLQQPQFHKNGIISLATMKITGLQIFYSVVTPHLTNACVTSARTVNYC